MKRSYRLLKNTLFYVYFCTFMDFGIHGEVSEVMLWTPRDDYICVCVLSIRYFIWLVYNLYNVLFTSNRLLGVLCPQLVFYIITSLIDNALSHGYTMS